MITIHSVIYPEESKIDWNKEGLEQLGNKLFDEMFLDSIFGANPFITRETFVNKLTKVQPKSL